MFPWSVMPMAGCPSAAAAAMTSLTRAAPSSIENSVWRWRCAIESPPLLAPPTDWTSSQGCPQGLWTDYTGVIHRTPRADPAATLDCSPSLAGRGVSGVEGGGARVLRGARGRQLQGLLAGPQGHLSRTGAGPDGSAPCRAQEGVRRGQGVP